MSAGRLEQILESFGDERRMKYSLDRMKAALKYLGNPEQSAQTIVIGGTNGKGTTSLLVSSALVQAGFRVGTYLSPHLQSPRERFVDGLRSEAESFLAPIAEELLDTANRLELSYFEYLTLVAFVWSKRRKHEFLILEVGLGGRLDATNVTEPLACAITSIGLDHQQILGTTVAQILEEKMGILRPESLMFSGVSDPSLKKTLEGRCNDLDTIYYFSDELRTEILSADWDRQRVRINGFEFELTNPSCAAAANAALAFLLVRIAFPRISISTIHEAFARARPPGRMESMPGPKRIILSGDHNPQGMASLCESLRRLAKGKLHFVCGFAPDKPAVEMMRMLKPLASSITLCGISRFSKNQPPSDALEIGDRYFPDPFEALDGAVDRLVDTEDTVVVTGSLYLVGELRTRWYSDVEYFRAPRPTFGSESVRTSGVPTPAKLQREG